MSHDLSLSQRYSQSHLPRLPSSRLLSSLWGEGATATGARAFLVFLLLGCSSAWAQEEPASEPSSEPTSEPTSEPASMAVEEPSSQPTSLSTTEPLSQPSSLPVEGATSEPSSQPEVVDETSPHLYGRPLPFPPLTPLVLRGIPEPVKRLRLGLKGDFVVFRNLPGGRPGEAVSLETATLRMQARLLSATTLELRFPVAFETRRVEGENPVQGNAVGNLAVGLSRVWGGKARTALSFELALPTGGLGDTAQEISSLAAISQRYELPLFLPGTLSFRGRVAVGKMFRIAGITGELGIDALFATAEESPLAAGQEINLRGGLSIAYRVSPVAAFFADVVFSKSLTGGEDGLPQDQDGLLGNLDDLVLLHIGAKAFIGRTSLGGFVSIPQDNPLGDLTNVGLGFQVSGALF